MIRATSLGLAVSLGILHLLEPPRVAWPYQVTVADQRGRPVPFQVVSHGAIIMVKTGERSGTPILRRLAAGDTLRASTPMGYPLDLAGGSVVFSAICADTLRVVVGGNPWGTVRQVRAQGRRLVVRLEKGSVVIDST